MTADVEDTLVAKEAELTAELAGLEAPMGDSGDITFGKRVGDGTNIAVERLSQVSAHGRLQEMLADVRRAQAKVAEGSYGACDGCGGPIGPERLEALPWATHCILCAGRR